MDKFGVPKKINRHVIKAIYELAAQGSESSDLLKICDMVEFTMKNNVPVANFRSAVRQSLINLNKLGVIKKQGKNYYTSSENLPSFKKYRPVVKNRDEEINTLKPVNKKRLLSQDSITEYHPESLNKRLRRSKPLSQKRKKAYFPKVRKHTDVQLGHSDGEVEHHSWSNSSNENGINSDEETETRAVFSNPDLNPQFFTEMFKIATLEEIGLENTNENSENVLHSLDKSSNLVQNDQLKKFDNVLMHDRINKFDVLNETESQLDEKKIDLQEDPVVLISKKDIVRYHKNDQLIKVEDVLIHERINKFDGLNENESQLDEMKNDLKEDPLVSISKGDLMTNDTNMNEKSTE